MSIKEEVIDRTVAGMLMSGYNADDIPAIRTISNDIMDSIEREGRASRKQTDRLSQAIIVKEVRRRLKRGRY
jgi:hypothetical protein